MQARKSNVGGTNGGCGVCLLTIIEKYPLSSCEQEYRGDDERRAVPYGDGSHEQKRAGRGDGGISSPLGEGEEGLTVNLRSSRERGQSSEVSEQRKCVEVWYPFCGPEAQHFGATTVALGFGTRATLLFPPNRI